MEYCPSKVKPATFSYITSGYRFQNKSPINEHADCAAKMSIKHIHARIVHGIINEMRYLYSKSMYLVIMHNGKTVAETMSYDVMQHLKSYEIPALYFST